MEKLKSKFILILTAFILLTGLGLNYLLANVFTEFSFSGYQYVPIFFFLIGLGLIFSLTQVKKEDEKKLVNKYMLMRVLKILISLLFILIYWMANKAEIKNFALVFIIFYMLFLIFETYIYLQAEKWMKKNAEVKKDTTDITE